MSAKKDDKAPDGPGSGLTKLIIAGLALGVLTGIFLGEYASGLKIIGQAYIGLLQMSILPYMVVSLIGGIGSLSYEKAGRLAVTGGLILVGSWVIAFAVVFLMPLAFPDTEAGSFFSPSLVEIAEVDFIDLYIPMNPFSSLARTVVPAAAVFSVALGIALIGVKNKQPLLDVLDATSQALTRVAMLIVRLTPIGVFAIAANAAGTMTIEDIGRLQTYVVSFIVATLVLTFWILPGLVTVLTPFTYRDVMRTARAALVTGFATGNLFIVLPLLIENAKRLFEERQMSSDDTQSYVEVLVPTSFNFPNIGKLLTLIFVMFAGWYTGKTLPVSDYPMFSVLGLFTLFGGVDLAIPFLLDQLQIPSDLYQLYVVTGVANSWFATLIAVMNLYAFTLVAACAATCGLTFDGRNLLRFVLLSVLILGAAIGLTRFGLSQMPSDPQAQRNTLMQMDITDPVPTVVHESSPGAVPPPGPGTSRLSQILNRGTLRVGYNPDNLPFTFFNAEGRLVGFDVDLVTILARELGLKLELVPWTYETVYEQLDAGDFDLLIGGITVTTDRLAKAALSRPYMTITSSLVVPDHLRNEFTTWEQVEATPDLRIAVTGTSRSRELALALVGSDVTPIDDYQDFLSGKRTDVDAIVISAEAGSAWTVLHPEFAVVIPTPHRKAPMSIAMAKGDRELLDFINGWLGLKEADTTLDSLYETWILGKSAASATPRWSVIRNVLHWVD